MLKSCVLFTLGQCSCSAGVFWGEHGKQHRIVQCCLPHVCAGIDRSLLVFKKKKRKKGSGKMCLLSILILELHDFAVLISFQLLMLNLCIDECIFVSLSPPKWVPLTAPPCLVQCNSASCSVRVLLLICGFRYPGYFSFYESLQYAL